MDWENCLQKVSEVVDYFKHIIRKQNYIMDLQDFDIRTPYKLVPVIYKHNL